MARFMFSMPDEMLKKLDEAACKEHRSRSELLHETARHRLAANPPRRQLRIHIDRRRRKNLRDGRTSGVGERMLRLGIGQSGCPGLDRSVGAEDRKKISWLSRDILVPQRPVVIYFLDTSAIAKRYLIERGSLRVRRLLDGKTDVFCQAFLRFRERNITSGELAVMLRAYVSHSHQDYLWVPYSDTLMERASAPLAHHPLRALDAVQLASALELKDKLPADELLVAFLSADERLVESARREHLGARNPERWS